jgi:hypothetical protein
MNGTNRSTEPTQESAIRIVPAPLQPILPGSRAVKDNTPLVRRIANVKTGDADAKLVMLTVASYADVWVNGDAGRAWASRETYRKQAELSERRWRRAWAWCLRIHGITEGKRRGVGETRAVTVHAVPL